MHNQQETSRVSSHGGSMVMNMGWRYDVMVAIANVVIFRGRLRGLFERALELAEVRPGDAVLDVGCGTGTLALLAEARVGASGRVHGIDPGPRQIGWARTKAARRGSDVQFEVAGIEGLPYADDSFDVAFSTLMMHHLPDDMKRAGLKEIARVLSPGGRLVVIDFRRSDESGSRFGAGRVAIQDLPDLMRETGFADVRGGDIPLPRFPGVHGAGYAFGRIPD